MKEEPAIAALEFRDIPAGIHTVDTLIKKAPIGWLKCGTVSRGRYLVLIGGSTASVDESYREGLYTGGALVVDHVFLPDIHPQLYRGVQGQRQRCNGGALGIIETESICSNLLALERALKGALIDLVEIRLADPLLHGKAVSIFNGELVDVEAAMELATAYAQDSPSSMTHRILTAPHEALLDQINQSTSFSDAPWMDLNGE